jgi:putative tricarboxylic transport membrane protein
MSLVRTTPADTARRRLAAYARAALAACALAAIGWPGGASAQAWTPARHVELIVPSTAGSSLDTITRMIERLMRDQKLVSVSTGVVNRPSAEHAVAYGFLKQRAGDPHFLSISSQVLLDAHISGLLPLTYTDLTPIAKLLSESYIFAVRTDSPIKTGKDFIEALKQRPDALSISVGTVSQRFGVAMLFQAIDADLKRARIVTMPSSKGTLAAAGGHVDVSATSLGATVPLIDAGQLRPIAVSSPKRLGGKLAQTPTWTELGYKNATSVAWRAMLAPPDITAAQVAYWESVLRRVSETKEFRDLAERQHYEIDFKGAAETRKFMETEYARQKQVMAVMGPVK